MVYTMRKGNRMGTTPTAPRDLFNAIARAPGVSAELLTVLHAALRRDWAVRVLDAWAARYGGARVNVGEHHALGLTPPDRKICTCPRSGPGAPTYWGSPRAIIVGHGPRCPWLVAHRDYLAANEEQRRQQTVTDSVPLRLWWCCPGKGFHSCELRTPAGGQEYRGATADAARHAAALAVWPELKKLLTPEQIADIGECP